MSPAIRWKLRAAPSSRADAGGRLERAPQRRGRGRQPLRHTCGSSWQPDSPRVGSGVVTHAASGGQRRQRGERGGIPALAPGTPCHPAPAGEPEQQQQQQQQPPASHLAAGWEAATRVMVLLGTLAFVCDTYRTAEAAAGDLAAAGGSTWVPLLSTLTSFFILSSVFIADQEAEGTVCYLSGLFGTLCLTAQAFASGAVPAAAFYPAAALCTASAALNAAQLGGHLQPGTWQAWRQLTGVVGWALLPNITWLTICQPAAPSWAPALLSGCLGAGLLAAARAGRLPRGVLTVWDIPAWTATLLFIAEPLAALAGAWRDPASMAAVAPRSFLLPALATGLQVPRALWVGNHMWTTGTGWATAMAAVQAALAAVLAGRLLAAGAVLCLLGGCATLLLRQHAAARGLPTPLASLQPLARAYGEERRVLVQLWHAGVRRLLARPPPPAAAL